MAMKLEVQWHGLEDFLKANPQKECIGIRPADVGEEALSCDGKLFVQACPTDCWARPIIINKWQFWPDLFPGAVCLTRDKSGSFCLWTAKPRAGTMSWHADVRESRVALPKVLIAMMGLTTPKSCGDWKRDIWFNPQHPNNW